MLLASRIPQTFNGNHLELRVIMALAATYKVQHTFGSPALAMCPGLSISPDWKRLGVRPKWAVTVLERLKRVGSSTAALKVKAVTKPTPGAVIRRWQTRSWCAI